MFIFVTKNEPKSVGGIVDFVLSKAGNQGLLFDISRG